MKIFFFILSLFIATHLFSQSVASFDYGGSYYSNDQGQFFSCDIIQTSKIKVDTNLILKVGFLNNRLLSLIANGQNSGTSTQIPIILYPNPAKTTINYFAPIIYEVKEALIYSSNGNLVLKASTQKTIDISSLAKGFYIIIIHFKNNRSTSAKFLKL